jgi:PAS domain S-box-containing protein
MSGQEQKNILIVEDDYITAVLQKKNLEKYGYNVIMANTGETAIETVNNASDIDLILMDINLGDGIDGTEAASLILNKRDVPLVFLSSHTEPEVVNKTEKITSYGYLVKDSGITVIDASIKMAFKLFEAKRKLAESDVKHKTMISNISDVTAIVDRYGINRYKSPNIKKWFGWSPEDVVGVSTWENVHPDHLERMQKFFGELLREPGAVQTAECPYRCKDGSYKWIELTAVNLTDDPIICGVLLNYHDISKRNLAEEKLLNSEIRYRRLFEAAQDGILILDAKTGMIVDVNPFLISLLGYSHDQFMGKAIWDIGFFKNIIESKDKFLQLQEKEYVRYENLPLENASGKIVEVEFVSNVYEADNQKVIQCNIRDITDRKHAESVMHASETRYRRLFETAKDGILILDAKTGMIVDVNPFLIKLLGYSYDQFMGKAIWDIGFFRNIIENKDKFLQLQEKEYMRYEDLPLETASGKVIEVEFVSNVYEADNQKVIQCNIRDITERKIAEEKIKALFEEKQLIIKEAHHRIKNNMNTVAGIMTLQMDTLTEPTAIAALEDARSRVISMMVLYNKLYRSDDFDKLSFKEYFTPLVGEIVGNFPNNRIVRIELNIEDFIIDSRRLSHCGIIINELITNIMKYAFTGRGNGVITLSAMAVNGRAAITLQDDGVGISESIDIAASDGFGLKLVEIMTQQLRGTLKIERDKGTRFILEFDL